MTNNRCTCLLFVLASGSSLASAQADEADIVETVETVPNPSVSSDTGDDVTESVGGDAGGPVPASPPSAASTLDVGTAAPNVSLNGWARQTFEWTFDDEGSRDARPDPNNLPRDKLVAHTQLLLRASYRQGDAFQAAVSGLLDASVHAQGTADGRVFTGVNGQRTEGRFESDLRDAYLGFALGPLDVRVGQQRVVWGRSDVYTPNDVINARDLRDPLLGEPELRVRPTPVLRVDLSAPDFSVQGVVAPVFVADRFDLFGSNWAAFGLDAPAAYRSFLNRIRNAVDPSLQGELQNLLQQTRRPQAFTDATSAGVKLAATFFDFDLSAYYQYGFDGTPAVHVDDSFAVLLARSSAAGSGMEPKYADLAPVLRGLDAGLRPFRAEYVRRHHIGFDASRVVGPLVLRIDAAYESARVFYAADLSSFVGRALLAVAGIEYQTGALDQILEIELIYIGLLDQPPSPLIGYARNTYAAAAIMRWPLFGPLSLNMRGIAGIAPRAYVLQPALRITSDAFALDLGALLLGGEPNSVGWFLRRNACAFVQARYAF